MVLNIIFGVLFSLAGLASLFLSFCLCRGAFQKYKNWKSATGIVVGHAETHVAPSPDMRKQKYFSPKVQFIPISGKPAVFTSNKGSTTPRNRIGDRVKVLYDLNNPDQGVINSFSTLYMPAVLFALFAVCFLGVGGHILFTAGLPTH